MGDSSIGENGITISKMFTSTSITDVYGSHSMYNYNFIVVLMSFHTEISYIYRYSFFIHKQAADPRVFGVL